MAIMPNTEPLTPILFKMTSMFINLAPDSEPFLDLFSFVNVPSLAKDCHKLGGLLTNTTNPVPDALWACDFNAALLFSSFSVWTALQVKEKIVGVHRRVEDQMDTMNRFLSHGALPSQEEVIQNAASAARKISADLREKATARIKSASF